MAVELFLLLLLLLLLVVKSVDDPNLVIVYVTSHSSVDMSKFLLLSTSLMNIVMVESAACL